MGDAQSAQREDKEDAAGEEGGGEVEDVQTECSVDKPPKTNGQLSEFSGKADSSIAALNGLCEEDVPTVVVISPEDKDDSQPLEDTPLDNNDIDQKEKPDEAHANEVTDEIAEMEAKENDINESFRKFFSNIGLKLTVKRGSTDKVEIPRLVPEEVESANENSESNAHLNTAQDSDSPTYQTLLDITSEEFVEKEEKAREEVASDDVDAGTSSPVSEDTHQGATSEEDQTFPSSPDAAEITTQFKKFFTSGIFSGLRKKKKPDEEDVTEKELLDMGARVSEEQEQDEEEITPEVERATNEGKSPSATDLDTNLQEKDKVQASPLKKLLSSSSLMKLPKKQKGRKSSDAKLSDSAENIADQFLLSTDSAGNQKEETADTTEEGAWASFIKLMTPQKRIKRPSVDQGEAQTPGPADGAKSGEGEQILDRSTEEGRKRKDSSVSWEAVLCGSGRRRSRKTSDSEDDNEENKQDSGPKEVLLGTSNEVHEVVASSPKQMESPPEDDGSTWKSFKKLVTPKRKVSVDEGKDMVQSDGEAAQDDSTFSIKKLLSGRKKRKSVERPDQTYPDDADKEAASDDEDSETPAVVPLSEFDTPEDTIQEETQADEERYVPKQADSELQQVICDETTEPVLPPNSLPAEEKEIQDNKEVLDNEVPTVPGAKEVDDLVDITSKYQQLSDIPEEGVITETTPASVTEVGARDDTIAEDLIEITSEAITAPEPTDVTQADETEMVSAVSQLSESSKTSGNTTPVPAEYNIMETEAVLQQVSQTFTVSPNTVLLCSEEPMPERIVCSVSHQVLESTVVDKAKILEIHQGLESTISKTDLSTEAIDAVDELAAEAQTESASHLKEAISTEIVSEVPSEEVDIAKPAEDEVHEVYVSELQESISKLEITKETQHVEEQELEVREERVPEKEGEAALSDEAMTDQPEQEILKTDFEEGESVATLAAETLEAPLKEEEVQILTEKETETVENISEQAPTADQTPAVMDQLEPSTAVETAALASEECDVKSLEVPPSEDVQSPEIEISESKETAEHLPKDIGEPEKPESDTVKLNDAEVPEALEVEQAGTLEDATQSVEDKVPSADISQPEMDTDEPKQTKQIAEIIQEPVSKETKEVSTADVSDNLEVLNEIQAATLESEESSVKSVENIASEGTLPPTVEQVPKEEAEPLTEADVKPEDAPKTEQAQEPLDAEDTTETETGEKASETPAAQEVEESTPRDLERETVLEDVPQPDETEKKALEVNDIGVKGSIPCDAEVMHEDSVAETVEELEGLTAVHAFSVSKESSTAQVVEKIICTEETPAPCVDNAQVSEEPIHEVNVCGVQESAQGEKVVVSPGAEVTAANASSVSKESSTAQVLEKTICTAEIPESCMDSAQVSEEPIHEVNVCGVQERAEVEKVGESPGPELTSVPVSSVSQESSSAQLLEKTICIAETPESCMDHAQVSEEPAHEVNVCGVQESAQGEKVGESPGAEVTAANASSVSKESSTAQVLEKTICTAESPESCMDIAQVSEEPAHEVNVCGVQESAQGEKVGESPGAEVTAANASSVGKESSTAQLLEKTICTSESPESCMDSAQVSEEPTYELNVCGVRESAQGEKVGESPGADLTSVPVSSVSQESSSAQLLEKTICTAESPESCMDSAQVSEEPAQAVNVCGVQESAQGEKVHESDVSGDQVKSAPSSQDVVEQVATCNLKGVLLEKPDLLAREHFVNSAATETELCTQVETTIPLEVEDIKAIADKGHMVVMRHMPTVEYEEHQRVQVQLMDVEIRSAQHKIDGVIEVGVTETKEVIDVCHETIQKVASLSAAPVVETDVFNEGIKVTVQDIIEHAQKNLTETIPESVVFNLEQVNEKPDEKVNEDGAVTAAERQDEVHAAISDEAEKQVSDDDKQQSSLESIDASIQERREDLEKAKDELKQSEESAIADELAVKKLNENTTETQRLQTTQNQIVSHANAGLAVPQNTGVISSVGNMESPSSLSLEFKLNIQFGQTKGPAPSPPPAEGNEPVKQADVSKVEVQVAKEEEPAQKQPELNEVAVQATEVKEPPADLSSTQRAVIISQPVLQDIGIQAMEMMEAVEQIKVAGRAAPAAQAEKEIQPRQKQRTAGLGEPETKQPAKQTDEENQDQDVWLDAEEDIGMQEEARMSKREVEDRMEVQEEVKEVEDEGAGLEPETEDKESQQEVHKITACEVESEGEDFAVALEDLDTSGAVELM